MWGLCMEWTKYKYYCRMEKIKQTKSGASFVEDVVVVVVEDSSYSQLTNPIRIEIKNNFEMYIFWKMNRFEFVESALI